MLTFLPPAEDPSGDRAADPVRDRQRDQRLVPGPHGDHQHTCEGTLKINFHFHGDFHQQNL